MQMAELHTGCQTPEIFTFHVDSCQKDCVCMCSQEPHPYGHHKQLTAKITRIESTIDTKEEDTL